MHSIIREDMEFIVSADLPWGELEGKKILISGGNGFLPSYMVETILFLNENRFRKKAMVFVLGRSKEKVLHRFKEYRGRQDLQFIIQDVCAPIELDTEVDFIIHAASQASPKYFGKDPAGTLSANVLGTHNLLQFARSKKVKGFLFFSAGEVYGRVDNGMSIKEDDYGYVDPVNVRSCYAESKRVAETMCASWMNQYGTPIKIVRPFHTYGPGINFDDGRVFADFVADVVVGRNIKMKSDGSAIRAFCYIADATVGFFTVLLKGDTGQAYNVGNDKDVISILELAHMLVNLFPDKKLNVETDIKALNVNDGYLQSNLVCICPNISKLRKIGWKPHFSLEEGFNRTIESFL